MKFFMSFFLLLGITCSALARVDISTTQPFVVPTIATSPLILKSEVDKVIPVNLRQGDDETTVIRRFADRGISYWFTTPYKKDTPLGQFAEKTQNRLKSDFFLPLQALDDIRHKVSFKLEVFQALAMVEYTGFLNARVNYDAKASTTDITLNEKVLFNKNLQLSHKIHKDEGLSMIGLAWSW